MLTSLIRDSFGIRIPQALLEQMGLGDAVELLVEKGRLIIQPERNLRRRWEDALASLAACVDDAASLGEVPDLPRRKA
jgi:antitoxin component of MazEF toxin-antitoxin module